MKKFFICLWSNTFEKGQHMKTNCLRQLEGIDTRPRIIMGVETRFETPCQKFNNKLMLVNQSYKFVNNVAFLIIL